MEIIETPLNDCYIIKVPKFGDDRGFFLESYHQKKLKDLGIDFKVKQVNFAKSQKNVLRGLHFQKDEFAQAKLVGVISGAVIDVAVDLRKESSTYLQHFSLKLEDQGTLFLVPKGFAHGYYTLSDNTIFHYAVDNFYAPESEGGILYNDPKLNIDWNLHESPLVSEKDLKHEKLQ